MRPVRIDRWQDAIRRRMNEVEITVEAAAELFDIRASRLHSWLLEVTHPKHETPGKLERAGVLQLLGCYRSNRKRGAKTTRKRSQNIDWARVDLNRPTPTVAAELGTSSTVVSNAKRRMGIQQPRVRSARPQSSIDWSAVDFSRPVSEIATSLGVSRQAVHSQRNRRASGHGRKKKKFFVILDAPASQHPVE